jgi:steroid delta-isomerase-like uncharacterized protein
VTLEENIALVRQYFEDARYKPELCDQIFAPHIHFQTIQHATVNAEVDSTPEAEKATYAWLNEVWGDWNLSVNEMIAEGDKVMVRWTFSGTRQGEYYGLPATHRFVSYAGINIFRIEKGKIIAVLDIYDRLWLWQQLGVLPEITVGLLNQG